MVSALEPRNRKVKNWFQAFAIKCNLYRYTLGSFEGLLPENWNNPAPVGGGAVQVESIQLIHSLKAPCYSLEAPGYSLQAPGYSLNAPDFNPCTY